MLAKFLIYLATVVGAIAFAALFIVIFGNSLEVQCARSTDGSSTCKISRALLGKYPLTSSTVTGIVDVKRDESCDAEDGCSYRALLVTSSGQSVPLNDVYTDDAPVEKQMDAISAFLHGRTDSFDYVEDMPMWVVELSVGLGLMTILIVSVNFIAQLLKYNSRLPK
jgi:hypothetical protein